MLIEPRYERKVKCKVFVMKISHSFPNKTNFQIKGFALPTAATSLIFPHSVTLQLFRPLNLLLKKEK